MKGCTEREAKAEHFVEEAPFIEIEKLGTAADQFVIDENHRHGLVLATVAHFFCHERVIGDIMLDKIHPLDAQEVPGTLAVSAVALGIDFYTDSHCNLFRGGFPLKDKIPQTTEDASNEKENSVKMTGWKLLCGFFMVLTLVGCNYHDKQVAEVGDNSLEDFASALRWKQYQVAASLMQPEFREEFIKTFTAFKDDLHISDVRQVDMQIFEEGRRIETVIEMDYTLLPSITLKTFTFDQIWIYTEESDAAQGGFFIVTPFPEFP